MPDANPNSNREPYCSNCGYTLTGLTESSKCPECGRPLVEVLTRPGMNMQIGRRFRSRAQIFGMPVIDIAIGPSATQRRGRARGFIAIGDTATGVLALGGTARGLVAMGGMAFGGFSFGGLSIGLLTSLGGCAMGGIVFSGFAAGGLAQGGGAIGYMAQGGMAVGHYARGGGAFGTHTISPATGPSQQAVDAFDQMSWLFGAWPPSTGTFLTAAVLVGAVGLALGAIAAIVACLAYQREPGAEPQQP